MTRINLVPPSELCDQHLLAEHRELTRIPNAVAKGKFHLKGQPAEYKLGEGHVRFFFNKMAFLKKRYDALHAECRVQPVVFPEFGEFPCSPAEIRRVLEVEGVGGPDYEIGRASCRERV